MSLTATHRKAGQVFHEVRAVRETATPPPLVLNDHCPICEFRDRCHAQAVAEDNLSLLRGMTEKDIRQHNRRGIFTVTQLSYTYRLRRKSARKAGTSPHHSFPLQAFAIRDKQVFLAYNRDDCAALKLVSDFIRGASIQVRQNGPDAEEEANRGIQVAFPPEAAPQFTRPNWGTPQFAQSDFEYINRCAFL